MRQGSADTRPPRPRRVAGVLALGAAAALATTWSAAAWPANSAPNGPAASAAEIVYTWANGGFTSEEIGLLQADGQRRLLTRTRGFDVAAAWSPDGQQIAFTSARSMPSGFQGEQRLHSELYLMNADGTDVRRVTFNDRLVDFQPAWSPDGRRIVVARGSGDTPPPGQLTQPTDLWIIDLATGDETQLTDSPGTWEGFPHWSPDGRRIAFEGDVAEPGNPDVYTIATTGRGLQRLTDGPGFDGDPHYSPDGRLLAFASDRTGNFDVFTVRPNGTDARQLTDDPGTDFAGGFSPDGAFLAFSSDRDAPGKADVFSMRADGSEQTNLTRTPGVFEFDPDWRPAQR